VYAPVTILAVALAIAFLLLDLSLSFLVVPAGLQRAA